MTSAESKPETVLKAIIPLMIAASLAGCNGGMVSSGGTTTPPPTGGTAALSPAASFYVVNQNYLPSTIFQFSRVANGSVAPASTIAGPAGAGFISLTVDALGSLYVGAQKFSGNVSPGPEIGPEILVYAAGATGTQSPSQTITAGLQALTTNTIAAIAVDSAQNLYAVTGIAVGTGPTGHIYTGVAVFAPNASGTFAPSKTIVGPLTEISNNASQMATDAAGNLYIASGPNISPGSIEIQLRRDRKCSPDRHSRRRQHHHRQRARRCRGHRRKHLRIVFRSERSALHSEIQCRVDRKRRSRPDHHR
jgi:hypothetical protein